MSDKSTVIYIDTIDTTVLKEAVESKKNDLIVNDPEGNFFEFLKENFPDCSYEITRIRSDCFDNENNEAVLKHDLLEIMQPRYRPAFKNKVIFVTNPNSEFSQKCYKIFCDNLSVS